MRSGRRWRSAKVGKIYIVGNEVTQDRVILRLLGLYPGQTLRYPEIEDRRGQPGPVQPVRTSRGRTPSPTITVLESKDDYGVYKDILVTVKETQTGSFMIGAGINSNAGLMGNIVLNERNFDLFRVPTSLADVWDGRAFRGAGQEFRIEAVPGTEVQRYTVSLREPYLFDQPYSLTTSFYYFERFYDEDIEERLGGRITVAHTFNNTWPDFFTKIFDGPVLSYLRESRYALSVNAGIRLEDVVVSGLSPGAPLDYTDRRMGTTWWSAQVSASPTTRAIRSCGPPPAATIDASVEADFGTFTYHTGQHHRQPLLHAVGAARRLRQTRAGPAFAAVVGQRQHPGIRPLLCRRLRQPSAASSSAASAPSQSNYEIGGDFMFLNSIEYQIPVMANDHLYFVAFVDSGTVESSTEINNYRVSAGVGMRLAIPMLGPLPLALDVGVPIVRGPGDHIEYIAFSVGFFH